MNLKGGWGDPQGYPWGPRGKSFVYNQILLNFTPKVYYWISLKDLESDLKYFIFGPPPGIPVFLTGTPRGAPRVKSFVYFWIQLKVATGRGRHPLGAEKSSWKEQEPLKAALTPWKWQGPPGNNRDFLEAAGIPWKLQGPPGFCKDSLEVIATPQKQQGPPRRGRDSLRVAENP